MSNDVAPAPAPAPAANHSLWKSLVFGTLGVIAIIIGVAKMTSGLSQMFGSGNEAVGKLLTESDEAMNRALAAADAGDKQLNELIGAVNAETLETLHADHATAIEETVANFDSAVKEFQTAAAKIDEALKLEVPEKIVEFLKLKSQIYAKYGEAYGHRRAAAAAMKDTAITDKAALIATINELAPRADQAIADGDELQLKADAISKEINEQKK